MRRLSVCMLLVSSLLFAIPARAGDEAGWQPKDTVEAYDNGVWRPATILQVKGGKYYVRYDGWGEEWDTWLSADMVRGQKPVVDGQFKIGDKVSANDNGTWRLATILATDSGRYHVHYEGWGSNWDTWLADAQVRAIPAPGAFKANDTVEADDGGIWRPATVLSVGQDTYFIHYIGWSDTWDAWVGPDRVRPAGALTTGTTAFKPGELVEVDDHGSWRRAVVRETNGSLYFIHYDGGDPALDAWVEPGKVRPLSR